MKSFLHCCIILIICIGHPCYALLATHATNQIWIQRSKPGWESSQLFTSRLFHSVIRRQRTLHNANSDNNDEWIDALLSDLEKEEVEGLEDLRVERDPQTQLRGLHTTTDWNPNEYLCAVPFPASIVVTETRTVDSKNDTYDEDNTSSQATSEQTELEAAVREDVEQGLAFWQTILPNPQYASYIHSLPHVQDLSTFDATPDFWTVEQIDQIPIPKLRETALLRKRLMKQVAHEHGTKSTADLQWACWIVRSRGFTTFRVMDSHNDSHEEERVLRKRKVLLPFLDLMNHDAVNFNCVMDVLETKDDDDASMYALQAIRPIQAGEAITICYGTGHETSLDLLDKYGFWVPEQALPDMIDGEEYLYNNPANANLDWSLVDDDWKEQQQQQKQDAASADNKSSDQATEFLDHLAVLYQKYQVQEKRIGFEV